MNAPIAVALLLAPLALLPADDQTEKLDAAKPVRPIPGALLGHDFAVSDLPVAPDPERARLGRWLFFDTRLSADQTISCATCHRPENAFSEPTPVSTGIRGQTGARKAPSFVNAVYAFYPATFWDGRAADLEEQAIGPIVNPIEMGHEHEAMVADIAAVEGYGPLFERAFGDPEVNLDRIAKAIADYERTRISGNSRHDQWIHADEDEPGSVSPMSEQEILGHDLWAFKTPGLRETTKHAPHMHDGSLETLRDVMDHYVVGGIPNPALSPKMEPLDLTEEEIEAIIAFMGALEGEGYMDTPPELFPQ